MSHRTEVQTVQKTVKSLTPSKPVYQIRACPEPVDQLWAKRPAEVMVKAKLCLSSSNQASFQIPKRPRPTQCFILTVQKPGLIRNWMGPAFFILFSQNVLTDFPSFHKGKNLPPENSQFLGFLSASLSPGSRKDSTK